MAMPVEYRDYPLLWYMTLVLLVVGVSSDFDRQLQAVELSFDQACCDTSRCPVIAVLSSQPKLSKLRHLADLDGGTRVTFRMEKDFSPRELWLAVAAANRVPARMTVGGVAYEAASFR